MYQAKFNGKTFELPKYTRSIANARATIAENARLNIKGQYDLFTLIDEMYLYILELIGEDKLKELLTHNDIDDVDVADLQLLFLEIGEVFDAKANQYQLNQAKTKTREVLSNLPLNDIKALAGGLKPTN